MKEFVQNILVYVIIITVLRGLITDAKYQQYFQFFSGVILILLFLTPVLSFLDSDGDWYQILEQKLMQMDLDEIRGEMKVAQEGFEQVLCSRYEEAVEEQVELLARQKGLTLEETKVVLEKGKDSWEVIEVSGRIEEKGEAGDSRGSGGKAGGENRVESVAVEAVSIGEGTAQEEREEDTSHEGKTLKKEICSSFALGKERVHIWK